MKIHCNKCLCDDVPEKADKNLFSLEAKCRHCGAPVDMSDSKVMLNVGRVFRIPCYIIMAYVVLYISKNMPDSFESFVYTVGGIVAVAALVYTVYCIIGNIVLFYIKK